MRNVQHRRMRGRPNSNAPQRNNGNMLTRSFESNGPDVKIRGTAQHIAEKYVTLARDAQVAGDPIMAENYLQHAEHYMRLIAAAQAQMGVSNTTYRSDEGYDEDDSEGGESEGETPVQASQPQPYVGEFPARRPQHQQREPRNDAPRNDSEREPRRDRPERAERPERNFEPREPREPREYRDNRAERQQPRQYHQPQPVSDAGEGAAPLLERRPRQPMAPRNPMADVDDAPKPIMPRVERAVETEAAPELPAFLMATRRSAPRRPRPERPQVEGMDSSAAEEE